MQPAFEILVWLISQMMLMTSLSTNGCAGQFIVISSEFPAISVQKKNTFYDIQTVSLKVTLLKTMHMSTSHHHGPGYAMFKDNLS